MHNLNVAFYSRYRFYLDELLYIMKKSETTWQIYSKSGYETADSFFYFVAVKENSFESKNKILSLLKEAQGYIRDTRYNVAFVASYYGRGFKFNTDKANRFIKTRYYIKYENESGSCVSTHYCNDDLDDIKTRLREIMVDNKIIYRERELRSIKSIEEIKKYCADHGAVLVKISDRIIT